MWDPKSNLDGWISLARHAGLAPQPFGSVAALYPLRPMRPLG